MTELARHKHDEADFFLKKMRDAEGNEFEYYLSAFLTSARTTTLALQSEYKGNYGFEDWYSKKQKEMKEDPLFDFMKNLRNRVAHPDNTYPKPREWPGVKTWPVALEEPPEDYETEDRIKSVSTTGYEFIRYRFPEESHEIFEEYQSYTVCSMSQDYLQKLEMILEEWEQKMSDE